MGVVTASDEPNFQAAIHGRLWNEFPPKGRDFWNPREAARPRSFVGFQGWGRCWGLELL